MLEALLFQRKGSGGVGGVIGTVPPSPTLASKRAHCAAIVGDEMFIGGGWNSVGAATASFQKVNVLTGVWTVLPDLPALNAYCYLTAVGTLLYYYGRVNKVHVFNTVTSTWTSLSTTPAGYITYGGVTGYRNGKLYVYGGDGADPVGRNGFREYDIATDTWRQMPLGLTQPIYSIGALVGDRLYTVGGGQSGTTHDTKLRYYDFNLGRWEVGPDTGVPAPWSGGRGVAHNGRLYLCGGNTAPGNIKTVLEYDPATNLVTKLPDMPTPRFQHVVAAREGKLYIHGGAVDTGATFNETFITYTVP